MTPDETAERKQRADDRLCEDLLMVLWKIRGAVRGETPIGPTR